jgi:hypothetical protein
MPISLTIHSPNRTKSTLQKLRVGDRCLINIISMRIRYCHDIVMKIDSTSLSLNLNMLIRCLFVINRSDVESTLNNDVENTLCRYRTDIENIYFDTSYTCTDIESTLKNCRPDTLHILYRHRSILKYFNIIIISNVVIFY